MIRHRFCLALLASSLLLAGALSAEDKPAAKELTVEECIRRALDKGFDLEIQRYEPQIAAESVEIAKDVFTPTVSVTASHGIARTDSMPGTKSESTDTRVGVIQKLSSGATVNVSTSLDRSASNPTFGLFNPAYDSDVSVSIRQPLLAGAGSKVTRAGVSRAEISLQRAHLDYRQRVLQIIFNTESAYYDLVYAREQLEVRRFSLNLAKKLHDEAKTRRDTGVATDLDVLQAEVGVANAQRSVVLAEQSVRDQSDKLLALIGQFELDSPLGETRFGNAMEALPVLASSLDAARRNTPEYLSAQAALEQAKLELDVARNGQLPDLSVGGAVGYNGTDSNAGSSFSNALGSERSSWQLDLSLSYPWGQKSDKARYRQNLAAVSQQTLRLRQIEQVIEVDVRSAVRAVEAGNESARIASLARGLSERQYELERAKFEAGLSTSRRVLEAQDDLETAKVNELQSRVSLRNAVSALHRLEGSSLARYGITLP